MDPANTPNRSQPDESRPLWEQDELLLPEPARELKRVKAAISLALSDYYIERIKTPEVLAAFRKALREWHISHHQEIENDRERVNTILNEEQLETAISECDRDRPEAYTDQLFASEAIDPGLAQRFLIAAAIAEEMAGEILENLSGRTVLSRFYYDIRLEPAREIVMNHQDGWKTLFDRSEVFGEQIENSIKASEPFREWHDFFDGVLTEDLEGAELTPNNALALYDSSAKSLFATSADYINFFAARSRSITDVNDALADVFCGGEVLEIPMIQLKSLSTLDAAIECFLVGLDVERIYGVTQDQATKIRNSTTVAIGHYSLDLPPIPEQATLASKQLIAAYHDPNTYTREFLSRSEALKRISKLEPAEIIGVVDELNSILIQSRTVCNDDESHHGSDGEGRRPHPARKIHYENIGEGDPIQDTLAALGKIGQHAAYALPGLLSQLGDPAYSGQVLEILSGLSVPSQQILPALLAMYQLSSDQEIAGLAANEIDQIDETFLPAFNKLNTGVEVLDFLRERFGRGLGLVTFAYLGPKEPYFNWDGGINTAVATAIIIGDEAERRAIGNLALFTSSFWQPWDIYKHVTLIKLVPQVCAPETAKLFLDGFVGSNDCWLRADSVRQMMYLNQSYVDTGLALFTDDILSNDTGRRYHACQALERISRERPDLNPRLTDIVETIVRIIDSSENVSPARELTSLVPQCCTDIPRQVKLLQILHGTGKTAESTAAIVIVGVADGILLSNRAASDPDMISKVEFAKQAFEFVFDADSPNGDLYLAQTVRHLSEAFSKDLDLGTQVSLSNPSIIWAEDIIGKLVARYQIYNVVKERVDRTDPTLGERFHQSISTSDGVSRIAKEFEEFKAKLSQG